MRFSILCLLFTQQLFAGNENFSSGARFMGMGNASASLKDAESWSVNQAGLAELEHITVLGGYQSLYQGSELSLKSLAIALPTSKGVFCLNTSLFGYSLYSENHYGISYSRKFGKNFSLGTQFDALSTIIPEYGSTTRLTGEFGLIVKLLPKLDLGAHVFNPFHVAVDNDPHEQAASDLKLGLTYTFSPKLLSVAELEKDLRYSASFKMGIEYLPVKNIALRAGFNSITSSFSFGAGYLLDSRRLDIAFMEHPVLGLTTQFSFVYAFH